MMGTILSYMNPRSNFSRGPRGERRSFGSYDECARVWIRQVQAEGRAGKGRMYFDGETIYSYRASWPLARIIYGPGHVAYVLVNNDRCSPTTSKHLAAVRDAINAYMGEAHSVFNVDTRTVSEVSERRRTELYEYFSREFADVMHTTDTIRCRKVTRAKLQGRAMYFADEANRFAKIFGDSPPFPSNAAEALAYSFDASQQEVA